MTAKLEAVSVSNTAGKRWWEVPDSMWRRVPTVRVRRLRLTVAKYILPVLQELESLYLQEHTEVTPKLAGRTMTAIEADDQAIETGLSLFDLALTEGLISFDVTKGANGANGAKTLVGSCGVTLAQGRHYYTDRAVRIVIAKSGKDAKSLKGFLSDDALTDLRGLQQMRALTKFDERALKDLRSGLKGHVEELFEKDDVFLDVLSRCHPDQFIRVLRVSLAKKFYKILDWSPEFLAAVVDGLDQNSKILALGQDLLSIKDPEVVLALGKWPVKEVIKRKKAGGKKIPVLVARIEEVRKIMGPDNFRNLLISSPAMVKQAETWNRDELSGIKAFLSYMTSAMVEALSPLKPDLQAGVMDGLSHRFGFDYFGLIVNDPSGPKMTENVVSELKNMGEGNQSRGDVKALILDGFFSKHFVGLPANPGA